MTVIGVVLARGGSKRIPKKNIRLLGGKPLIAWTIETAKQCPSLDAIVVSTDDNKIAEIALEYGAQVPFLRPPELARDDTPRWSVWRYLLDEMEKSGTQVDILVDLQVPAPFRSVDDVEECIRKLRTDKVDAVVSIYTPDHNPYFNMVEIQEEGYLNLVKALPQPPSNRQEAPPVYSLTPVCFAVRGSFAKSGRHLFEGKVKSVVIPPERALDIDTELDWAFAEFLLRRGVLES